MSTTWSGIQAPAGFHCFCLPGQMIVGKVPVTFCFTINWTGPDDGVAAIFKSYVGAVADVLGEAAQAVGWRTGPLPAKCQHPGEIRGADLQSTIHRFSRIRFMFSL